MKKRIQSLALALVMLAVLVPFTVTPALAAGEAEFNVIKQTVYEGALQETVENYHFILDEEAIGEWEVVDFVGNINDFKPGQRQRTGELLYSGNTFLPNGTVIATFHQGYQLTLGWTRGLTIDGLSSHAMYNYDNPVTVPEYEIRYIDGNAYMFLQWKTSGDYIYRGQTPPYYVFVKKSTIKYDDELFAGVLKAKKAVEDEYKRWSSILPQKREIPGNQKIPFRIMWLAYTNATHEGKTYRMTESDVAAFKKSIDAFEALVEKLTDNNVDIINDYKSIDRQVEATNEHTNEFQIGISPRSAKAEMDMYAPIGKYNFVYTVSAVPSPENAGANYRNIHSGQGFASSTVVDIARNPDGYASHYLHEMLHSFEFRSATPIDIEMPLLHISCCEFPVGYEKYRPGGEWFDEGYTKGEGFLTGNIKYTDPNTGEISYVGVYPSMWKYVIALHAFLADAEVLPFTLTEAPNISSADTWAQDGIQDAYNKGFIPADLQNNYKKIITRAEFCRMAVQFVEYRMGQTIDAVIADKGLTIRQDAFSDTNEPDILAAFALGITSGTKAPTATTPGTFTPDGEFTRQQAATMIMNTCKVIGMDTGNPPTSDFVDLNDADTWARAGINFVRDNGIMSGTSATTPTFSPKATYTRQQSIMAFNNIN